MNDLNTKMLQAIIDGQSAFREQMMAEIQKVRNDIKNVDEKLTLRIDKIGRQLAYLEDDASTREEHQSLEKRVNKIELRLAAPAL